MTFKSMKDNELEEKIYEYGETMKHIGRCETDGKTSMKEYSKLISQKEKLIKEFDLHFKNSSKIKNTLSII